MKQAIKNIDKGDIKSLVSTRFINALQEAKGPDNQMSDTALASMLNIPRTALSKVKKGDGYFATVEMLFHGVNELGLNANKIFKQDNSREAIFQDSSVNNHINGDNNQVNNQKGKINSVIHSSSGDINIAEKIIQNVADPKDRKRLQKQFDGMNNELGALKKMLDLYEKQIKDKDNEIQSGKKLISAQEKLIKMFEDNQAAKNNKK